jgi:hypothetical protein
VIPKDKAVFWMDENGRWHNQHGPFQHKKIIDYFNASIQKDENGYFVQQSNGNVIEKVYFRYQETALFVVDLVMDDPIVLKLNTRLRLELDPEKLILYNDKLYYCLGDEVAKFNERSLLKISENITCVQDHYYITIGSRKTVLAVSCCKKPG